jgi:hypothetical protein
LGEVEQLKKNILESILTKNEVALKEVITKIDYSSSNNNVGTLFYTSFFENLGNKNSDIDIYIFLSSEEELGKKGLRKYSECLGVDVIRVGELELDIEYWTVASVEKILKKLVDSNGLSGNYSDLKILLRIFHGYFLESNEVSSYIMGLLESHDIIKLVKNRIAIEARSLFDEAVKMYEVNEKILSLDCARRCLWECASYMNAHYGKPNLKQKWISKIFIDNKAFGNSDLLDDYINLQIFSNITKENLDNTLLDMFTLIQSMLNVDLFD